MNDEIEQLRKQLEACQAACARYLEVLQELSILGNGHLPGNSIGNQIAQRAIVDKNPGQSLLHRLKVLEMGVADAVMALDSGFKDEVFIVTAANSAHVILINLSLVKPESVEGES